MGSRYRGASPVKHLAPLAAAVLAFGFVARAAGYDPNPVDTVAWAWDRIPSGPAAGPLNGGAQR